MKRAQSAQDHAVYLSLAKSIDLNFRIVMCPGKKLQQDFSENKNQRRPYRRRSIIGLDKPQNTCQGHTSRLHCPYLTNHLCRGAFFASSFLLRLPLNQNVLTDHRTQILIRIKRYLDQTLTMECMNLYVLVFSIKKSTHY